MGLTTSRLALFPRTVREGNGLGMASCQRACDVGEEHPLRRGQGGTRPVKLAKVAPCGVATRRYKMESYYIH